ncbi:MAG TPA: DUF5916 domain-containing protein [Thermoanaerobaculia bacterium]|nr:DUF5916 domain-containing protein [Thermoanaerobaculia bacterium]
MKRQIAALGFVCLLAASAIAAPVEVRRASSPIRVDAVLDEEAWREATPIAIAYEWYPSDDTPAPVATEAFVTWDERKLYVAFRAHDPKPATIRARYHDRDAGRDDDLVGFYIDPFNDDRRAYQFLINPLGVQSDAINSDVEGTEDFSWDGIWESAGRLTPDGYVVEVAIPLQQLRIPSGAEAQTWGFLAFREWPRDVKHRLRSTTTDQNRNCLICQFHDLSGIRAASSGRNLELQPTLTGSASQFRDEAGPFGPSDSSIEPGLSARWGITPGTSLQATLNPDFSQVEADAAQLDVNTRFALFFPEKRPFFVEGADFFDTQLPLVFTRTIADPLAGMKLTGKSGNQTYGVLLARDRITNLLIPSDAGSSVTSIDSDSTTAIARYRADIGKKGTIGGLISTRDGDGYANTVVSADSYFRVTERDSVRVQLAGSHVRYPAAIATEFEQPSSDSGHAILATYRHADKNWTWNSEFDELSPGFRADSGFINQVGVRAASWYAERRIRGGADRWFRNLYVGAGMDGTQQFDRQWNEWGADLNITYQGPHQSSVALGLAPNQEYYRGTTYHNFRQSLSASIQASPDLTLRLAVRWGEQIDFRNARPADFITLSPGFDLNLGRHLQANVSYDRQVFETKDGRRIFAVDLPQARLLYHFTNRLFVRTILEYQSVTRDPIVYTPVVNHYNRELLTQFLLSYRLNAQTVFLAGYSDNYENLHGAPSVTQLNRAVFLKLGYAWLF